MQNNKISRNDSARSQTAFSHTKTNKLNKILGPVRHDGRCRQCRFKLDPHCKDIGRYISVMDVLILFPSRHVHACMCCRIFVCNKLWNRRGFLYLQTCHQKPTALGYLDVKCHIKSMSVFPARASVACVWKSCFAQV